MLWGRVLVWFYWGIFLGLLERSWTFVEVWTASTTAAIEERLSSIAISILYLFSLRSCYSRCLSSISYLASWVVRFSN